MKYEQAQTIIQGLIKLSDAEKRGPLARIRRGAVPEHFFDAAGELLKICDDIHPGSLGITVAVAASFVSACCEEGKTTLPQAFARIAKGGGIDGVPLRFRLLLESSDENELRDNLLNALAVLRREGIAINWTQLLFDAANWVISPETVANRWSQSYLFALRRTAEKRGES